MSHLVDVLASLANSENNVAAGLGEVLQAFVAGSYPSPGPILIEFGHRTMALGRKRMSTMTGRVSSFKNAFLYVKGKFGLLNASTPLFLQAVITGRADGAFVEIDLDAWEEIVPYIEKLRIIT
ncbi:uncharacterized protein C8R40DRAFT_1098395 [Lentinula edodes]|uniref:uncharacterized protein n=1 Tax=Lentinula edodes TaxID=5353 RepID=UPI001E8DE93A|nr:uncharacterized protein C8R40DRAFT_1098395 [Lentinula edodes]KAH7876715.1 hypothetical protein C8R40DRAFT_1098395 [Lentinula edodes]